jgi:hypothetical protein
MYPANADDVVVAGVAGRRGDNIVVHRGGKHADPRKLACDRLGKTEDPPLKPAAGAASVERIYLGSLSARIAILWIAGGLASNSPALAISAAATLPFR